MPARTSYEKGVCPSVCPSVKRVNCDKTDMFYVLLEVTVQQSAL